MKIHASSFIRAGTAGAILAGLLLLLALTPFFEDFLAIVLVTGALIIPLCTGIYYGRLAPGEETLLQSIIGGALSGLVGGIILGIAFGLNAFMLNLASGILGYAIASSIGVTILATAILGLFGLLLGALGGIIWQLIQRPEEAEPVTQEAGE